MLSASRANILKPNHSTTAIAIHNPYFFLSYSLYRYSTVRSLNVKEKKSAEKLFFVAQYLLWHEICYICHFGRSAAPPAILAVSLADCHYCKPIGSARTSPLLEGVCSDPVDMTDPLPSMGGSVTLTNQTELTCQLPPIMGVTTPPDPFANPLISRNGHKQARIESYHFITFILKIVNGLTSPNFTKTIAESLTRYFPSVDPIVCHYMAD
jgi:hypothetical protein